jgi:hypothetical protein
MRERELVRALRAGDVRTVEGWARTALPKIDLEQLSGPVVRHPLEFICMPLWRDEDLGLCLHVWPWEDRDSSPVVHAHSWDLWSYVVCGTVINDVMSVRDEEENPEFGLYVVTSSGRVDEFQETGRMVACAPNERQEIPAGHVYRLSSGRFHRSGHRDFTVTLVLGEQREGLDNLVLGPTDGYHGDDLPRETCSPDEARALIERIVARCRS